MIGGVLMLTDQQVKMGITILVGISDSDYLVELESLLHYGDGKEDVWNLEGSLGHSLVLLRLVIRGKGNSSNQGFTRAR